MSSRTRALVLGVSIPVIVFTVIGGYLGRAMAQGDETFRYLRVFEDVVSLVLTNYVEPVDVTQAMKGAMKGLADSLDPESAYLTPELVKSHEGNVSPGPAEVGIDVSLQSYLRVVAARDGSPAARAGRQPGDFIRAIDNRATRDMSSYEGARLLRGAAGSTVSLLVIRGNAADPHEVTLVRERLNAPTLTSRMADPTAGYIRVAEFTTDTASRLKQAFDALAKSGAVRYLIDLRGTSRGDLDDGVAAARLFVREGTLAVRQGRNDQRETMASQPGDGAITAPVALVVDAGTAGAAEVFAAALQDHDRADLVGQNTLGRAARQRLVKLPDASGLWLTYVRYLTPDNDPIHQAGLEVDVEVEQPEIEFGAAAPTPDVTLQKAIETLGARR
ncbi:MAG: PDZ domain-containing protein [Acidobacteria bacterium]|nr:PDZ domain-containing protein [Acidobacteriota bacterium]